MNAAASGPAFADCGVRCRFDADLSGESGGMKNSRQRGAGNSSIPIWAATTPLHLAAAIEIGRMVDAPRLRAAAAPKTIFREHSCRAAGSAANAVSPPPTINHFLTLTAVTKW
jgi:hypothetical protein